MRRWAGCVCRRCSWAGVALTLTEVVHASHAHIALQKAFPHTFCFTTENLSLLWFYVTVRKTLEVKGGGHKVVTGISESLTLLNHSAFDVDDSPLHSRSSSDRLNRQHFKSLLLILRLWLWLDNSNMFLIYCRSGCMLRILQEGDILSQSQILCSQ